MKGKESIINFIVIVALLGYIICSFLLFKEAFDNKNEETPVLNSALMYITSALTGLVGGIVAAAFGVKTVENNQEKEQSTLQAKFSRVGEYTTSFKNEKSNEKIGNLYTWSYIIVGIVSIIIWAILNEKTTQSITNTGMTFIGMVVAIVGAFFKK